MRTRQKQRIIIGTLCAVIIGLAVGYAILSGQLNINGSGGIASDFNILFTDIGEGTMNDVADTFGVRPVIMISPDVQILGGNGTFNSPFQI